MDTNQSIPVSGSRRSTFQVTMTDDKGNKWLEPDYEGYGVFGGKDFYALLAEMNGIERGGMDEDEYRGAGIELAFSDKPHKQPNLSKNPDWKWVDRHPENCEYQGFFY